MNDSYPTKFTHRLFLNRKKKDCQALASSSIAMRKYPNNTHLQEKRSFGSTDLNSRKVKALGACNN